MFPIIFKRRPMKKFFLCLVCFHIYAETSLENYFSYLNQLNREKGSYMDGEIEVITDPKEILPIQKKQESRLLQKGFSQDQAAEFSRIGIIYEDQYWVWLRDAVYFPAGISGTYNRLLWKHELSSKASGVAILPILPSGKIVLILTYRHATRSWEIELPRGGLELGETPKEAAIRELQEETGFTLSSIDFLGEMAVDSGALSLIIHVFMGQISTKEESNKEYSEAIHSSFAVSKEELKEGLVKGYLEIPMQNSIKKVPLRDAFLTFALLQAEYRKLL